MHSLLTGLPVSEQLTRLVRNATIVIGSFSLAFTAAPVLAGPSFGAFLSAALIAVAGIAVAFTFLHLAERGEAR